MELEDSKARCTECGKWCFTVVFTAWEDRGPEYTWLCQECLQEALDLIRGMNR